MGGVSQTFFLKKNVWVGPREAWRVRALVVAAESFFLKKKDWPRPDDLRARSPGRAWPAGLPRAKCPDCSQRSALEEVRQKKLQTRICFLAPASHLLQLLRRARVLRGVGARRLTVRARCFRAARRTRR